MVPDLFEQLAAVVQALDRAAVPYALAGGLALAVHGVARATSDIDLLVPRARIDEALEATHPLGFRFAATPMIFPDGMELRRITRIAGKAHTTLDLLLVDEALRPAWDSRQSRQTAFGPLVVVSREGLIAMKIAAGRPQDLADVARLQDVDR
jgi:hypothetical protein